MKTAYGLRAMFQLSVLTLLVAQSAGAVEKRETPLSLSQIQVRHLHALKQAQAGNRKGAVRELKVLSEITIPVTEHDRVLMSIGRIEYEIGQYEGAIAAYEKVDRGGPSWIEALEETAWAEFRQGHPEKAIAKLKTVTSVAFKDDTKSEPFFLLGLAQLRVCDFKAVFKTIDLFKSRFAETTKLLESSKTAANEVRLNEISETVQKLNLVEAETIQRLYVDENGKKRKGSPPSILRSSDELSFPTTDDDEFWLDEVDAYKVSLKGCLVPSESIKTASSSSKVGVQK